MGLQVTGFRRQTFPPAGPGLGLPGLPGLPQKGLRGEVRGREA